MSGYVCIGALENCYNPEGSYGEICVGCNCCGRLDKSTMHQCRIAKDKLRLEEAEQDLSDERFQSELQQKNIRLNIEYFKNKIKEAETAQEKGE